MSASPSLRERRKSETWLAVHDAAAELALRRGFEQTTVEAIAAAAGISPRTFFNYFPTKDDAVLGVRAPTLDPALLEGFSLERDVLDQVAQLLLEVARSAYGSRDLARRRRLVEQHPRLAHRRRELMSTAEELVCQELNGRLAQHPDWSAGIGQHPAREVARMLVMQAGVPLRWALTSPDHDPAVGLSPKSLAPSLSLLHQLQRKVS